MNSRKYEGHKTITLNPTKEENRVEMIIKMDSLGDADKLLERCKETLEEYGAVTVAEVKIYKDCPSVLRRELQIGWKDVCGWKTFMDPAGDVFVMTTGTSKLARGYILGATDRIGDLI